MYGALGTVGNPAPEESVNPVLVSLDDASAFMKLDGSEDPGELQSAVDSANQAVVDYLGWDPRSLTVLERVDGTDSEQLVVGGRLITAVIQIRLMWPACQPSVLDLTNITFDPKLPFIYGCHWCAGSRNYEVTYTRGYPVLPATIIRGVLYTCKAILDAAGVDFNATGEYFQGVANQTWADGGPGTVPQSAKTLLAKYRRRF